MEPVRTAVSRLFCPDRYLFSSKDALYNDRNFYSSIRIPLRMPIMGVKSCELIRANIPNITTSIPDTALCFWYYRLPKQLEYAEPVSPSFEYLHCIRLQPSYLHKELIADPDIFDVPVNRLYDGYEDLLVDLNKACKIDVNNPFFIENDISFTYDEVLKKFSFTGENVNDMSGNLHYFYRYAGYNDPNVFTAQQMLFSATENNFGIIGLKGQPFYKGETLNKRLGFLYNGSLLSDNEYKALCRPVPHFLLQNELPLFDVHNYVAESYCNLVHTANVNIYANFICGSGYSTSSGNNNFLNSVALSTGQLGVASYQNSLSTNMFKVNSDISEVMFEFRCDNGEDFLLPRSAISLLEIKFSYTI